MEDYKTVAKEIEDIYENKYNQFNLDVLSASEEGFRDGLKLGTIEGILHGLNECSDLGFSKVRKSKIRSLEEISRDLAVESLKSLASSRTRAEICPILKDELRKQCDHVIHRLTVEEKMNTAAEAADLLGTLNLEGLADKKMEELAKDAKRSLPSNFIVRGIFSGLQEALWDCLKDSIKDCKRRIQKAAGSQEES